MPEPAKVRLLADDLGVDYNWLYFGSKPAHRVAERSAYSVGMSPEEAQLLDDFRLCAADVQVSLATLARVGARAK